MNSILNSIAIILIVFSVILISFGVHEALYMGVKNAENTLILQRDLINLQEILLKK